MKMVYADTNNGNGWFVWTQTMAKNGPREREPWLI